MADVEAVKQRLESYLKTRHPEREALSVQQVERMPVGVSYETYLFAASWTEGSDSLSESLVVRMEPETGPVPPYDVRPQYEALRSVHGTGIPVPKVHWLEMDRNPLGRPFFVMDKVEGETLLGAWTRSPDQRGQLMEDYVSILATLHALDWRSLELSSLNVPEHECHHAEKEIARWEWVIEDTQFGPQPVVAELVSWLRRNIPTAERTTLCHGDYHSRNFLARDGRIVAVLDWEMVDIGDPISDLAWHCMFMRILRENAFWPEDEFIRSYEEKAGVQVNRDSLFFWEILSFVKLTAIGLAGLRTGIDSSDLDMRQVGLWTMLLPLLQDAPARMLGF